LPQIETDYIKTGKVKYVVMDFPLEAIHANAFKAAEAARCAMDQGKFWEMHSRLFANQRALTPEQLPKHAEALGLDVPTFKACLDGGKYAAEIRKGLAEGQKAGVTGTPGFFLGMTNPSDAHVTVLGAITGAQPYANFKAAIDGLLSSEKPK